MAQVAEIFLIEAPAEAVAGARVDIRVHIKNKANVTAGIMVGGALENDEIPWPKIIFPNDWANFPPWQEYSFEGYFTMPYYPPGKVITIHAYSYYYSDPYWYPDDAKTRDIKIVAEVEPPAPTFSAFKITDYRKD